MFDWLTGIVGEDAAPIATYILIFLLLLIGFFVLRAALRRMNGGTFVHGGQDRKQRLAIIDATPVDNRRRLVLVRRDNVEHLVLIGGMNDLVIERDIELQASNIAKASSAKSAPTPAVDVVKPAAQPLPKASPAMAEPKPQPAPIKQSPAVQPAEVTIPTPATPPAPAPSPVVNPSTAAPVMGAVAAMNMQPDAPTAPDIDNAMREAAESETDSPVPDVDPAVPETSFYDSLEATVSDEPVDKPAQEGQINDLRDEFKPIDSAEPAQPANDVAPPVVVPAPQVPQDEADLEDEMEQLLNKLTSSSSP